MKEIAHHKARLAKDVAFKKEVDSLKSDLSELIASYKDNRLSESELNQEKAEFMDKIASVREATKSTFSRSISKMDNGRHLFQVSSQKNREMFSYVFGGTITALLLNHLHTNMTRAKCRRMGASWCWCKEGADTHGNHKKGFCCNTEDSENGSCDACED